jgi:hypothetical protein
MSTEREPHNSFERSAAFYLEAAQAALMDGQPRLAIHLFRAAFEIESSFGSLVSSQTLAGLRKAWDLALELGDRSVAESIFSELAPHNSSEQNERATTRLQTLALGQLEDMGITVDDLEGIADVISQEMVDSNSDKLLDSLKSALEHIGLVIDDDENDEATEEQTTGPLAIQRRLSAGALALSAGRADKAPAKDSAATDSSAQESGTKTGLARIGRELREFSARGREEERQRRLDYQALSGYTQALERMKGFGFLAASDASHRLFIERSAAMHGVSQLSLDGTFLFCGPAREDVSLFAHATAGEIGSPVLHISVDLDAQGNGTIKLVGPFKRGLFGNSPDFMDMITPCTVLIENIDLLQEMFDNEQQAIKRGAATFRGMMGVPARSMQAEMTGYLRALRQKPDVVIMATTQDKNALREPLRSLLGVIHEIEVAAPREDERRAVLVSFAGEHPSFAELDIDRIAQLSEGLSRNELVYAAHAAVEAAYRGSLRTGRYNRVTLGDVMMQLAPFLDQESPLYQQVEDEAVIQLARELEEDMYHN